MRLFKRILKITGFLIIMAAVYAAGAYTLPDFDILLTPEPLPPSTYTPPADIDPIYTELGAPAVTQYGNPRFIINNNDPLHAYIRYPEAGNPTDSAIKEWAYELFDEMTVRFSTGVELSPLDFGEINIQFDSYLIDNRYAGIHQYGEYSYATTESTHEVIKTFNIDLAQFRILEPGDILDLEENAEGVLALLSLRLLVEHPRTDGYHVFMDEGWLDYLLITHEGIKVFLPHNEFLPDSFKTLTVMLPYEDLGSLLLIRHAAPLPDIPVYIPPGEETPAPSPVPDPDDDTDDGLDGDTDGDPDINDDGDTGGDPDSDDDPDNDTGNDPAPDPDDNTDGDTDGDSDGDTDNDMDNDDNSNIDEKPYQSGRIDPERPVIALSLDAGPGEYTEEFLDLLEEYGVRATFFTTGNLVHTGSELYPRAVEMGCEIAAGSWNHKNMAKMHADDVRLQLETTISAIEEITGVEVTFFRPPYGAVSETLKSVAEEMELSIIGWSADPEDWRYSDADTIYGMVMSQLSDRAIIISHDVYESTLDAYRQIIPDLLLQGYQIVTVSEMLNLTHRNLSPGQVYYNG